MNNKEEHDQIFELIPEFALGILDANEAQFVRQHLEGCIACQQELASYESVVDALSLASPTIAPPANLKAQLFEQIGEPAASETVSAASWWQPVIDRAQTFLAGPRWQPALVLVAFAVLVGALYFWQQSNRLQPEQYELTATDVAPDAQGLIEAAARGQDATLNVSGLPVRPPSPSKQHSRSPNLAPLASQLSRRAGVLGRPGSVCSATTCKNSYFSSKISFYT
jgi:anti-sigma factor RsiW